MEHQTTSFKSLNVIIRLQSAGTSAQFSSVVTLWSLVPSLGVKAPCRLCRGWQRGSGWGHPPQSYRWWPQWPTETAPSSCHAPWFKGSLSHQTSEVSLNTPATLVNLAPQTLPEKKTKRLHHQFFSPGHFFHVHMFWPQLCWGHRWAQLSKDYFLWQTSHWVKTVLFL